MSSSVILYSDTHFHNHTQFGGSRVPEGLSVLDEEGDRRFPGCNRRAVSLLNTVEWVFTYALNNKIKYLYHAGDVFHTKNSVPIAVMNAASKIFKGAAEEGLNLRFIPGNHDLAGKSNEWTSLHTLYTMSHVVAFQVPTVDVIAVDEYSLGVALVPYMASKNTFLEALDTVKGQVDRLRQDGKISHAILVMHTSLEGAVTGPNDYIMKEGLKLSDIPFKSFDGVFSGHYHKHQVIQSKRGEFVYIGALAQHNFGERDYTPGFLVVTLEPGKLTWQHVENKLSPRFNLMELDDVKELETACSYVPSVGGVDPDYLKIIWKGGRLPVGLKVQHDFVAVDTGVVASEAKPRLEISLFEDTPKTLIESYAAYALPPTLKKKRLIEVGLELLNE